MGSPSVLSNSTGKGASLKLGGGKWWDGKELFLYSGCHENRPTQAFPKCQHKRLRTNLIGRISDWVARGIPYFLYAGGVGFQGTGKAILSFAAKKCLCLAGVSRPKGRERRFTGLIRRARHERLGLRPCGRVLFMWGRLAAQCHILFAKAANPAEIVGRTPLDPLFANEISIIHTAASRRGCRLRTGGSAPQSMQTVRYWEKYAALGWQPAAGGHPEICAEKHPARSLQSQCRSFFPRPDTCKNRGTEIDAR